jgi:hypothetical protein
MHMQPVLRWHSVAHIWEFVNCALCWWRPGEWNTVVAEQQSPWTFFFAVST